VTMTVSKKERRRYPRRFCLVPVRKRKGASSSDSISTEKKDIKKRPIERRDAILTASAGGKGNKEGERDLLHYSPGSKDQTSKINRSRGNKRGDSFRGPKGRGRISGSDRRACAKRELAPRARGGKKKGRREFS